MNNPNEAVLVTDSGHPVGSFVFSNGTDMPPAPNEEIVERNRAELLRVQASEITGEPDADAAIADTYPGFHDQEKRKKAMNLFITGTDQIAGIAKSLSVPERTVSMWVYTGKWDELLKKEIEVRSKESALALARIRADRRAKVAEEQLKAAEAVRCAGLLALAGGKSLKGAADALKSAADVEARILGVSESGAVVTSADGSETKKDDRSDGKTPLVVVFQGGGLPPVRKHQ